MRRQRRDVADDIDNDDEKTHFFFYFWFFFCQKIYILYIIVWGALISFRVDIVYIEITIWMAFQFKIKEIHNNHKTVKVNNLTYTQTHGHTNTHAAIRHRQTKLHNWIHEKVKRALDGVFVSFAYRA